MEGETNLVCSEQPKQDAAEVALEEFNKAKEQRMGARRKRVGDKVAAKKKAEGLDDGQSVTSSMDELDNPTAEDLENMTPAQRLEKQIAESKRQIEQIILDGEVLITNVRVAAEYREKEREKQHDENYKDRLERLQKEDEESKEMYDKLSENWNMKAEKALPMDLYNQMKAQQEACDELMAKKEDIISYLRREIDENDFEYEASLEKYQKDTMLMGDRIDDLMDSLRIAFIQELNVIEQYTTTAREEILENDQKEWMALLQKFEEMEKRNLEERKTGAVSKFQAVNEMYTLTKQDAREKRHKAEDDLRILFQEREQLKYACHLNLEKMAYNLHIVNCRAKENVDLKNMMKRLLLRLHDKMQVRTASFKKKIELGRKHTQKMAKEIQRLTQKVESTESKNMNQAASECRKFADLWTTNTEIIKAKVKTIADSNKFIYETQLGIEYAYPDLSIFDVKPSDLIPKKRESMVEEEEAESAGENDVVVVEHRCPPIRAVTKHWENILNLVQPDLGDLWDTVQQCFDMYYKVLKKRNERALEMQRLYQSNFELSHLLQKYFQSGQCG